MGPVFFSPLTAKYYNLMTVALYAVERTSDPRDEGIRGS
jgi:hypothetical protein